MHRPLALGVLVAAALLVRADEAGDAKKELERFTGDWKGVSATIDGKELSKEDAAKITLTVKGEKYTFKDGTGATIEGTHKLGPSKKPKQLDAERAGEKGTIKAIYELTDDTYKICLAPPGKDRPESFASKEGSGHRLMTFKRAKE